MNTKRLGLGLLGALIVIGLSACDDEQRTPSDYDRVYIDSALPAATAIDGRIVHYLRDDDRIAIALLFGDDIQLVPGATSLVIGVGIVPTVQVVADDDQLDQASAEALYNSIPATFKPESGLTTNQSVDLAIAFINKVHGWQDQHPRPVVPPGPPFNWGPVWAWVSIVLMVPSSIVAGWKTARCWWRAHRRRLTRKKAEAEEIKARADEEQRRLAAGDSSAIYGQFKPIEVRAIGRDER